MNLLIIIVCVLIKATLIITKTMRLPVTKPPNINLAKLAQYYPIPPISYTTTTTPLPIPSPTSSPLPMMKPTTLKLKYNTNKMIDSQYEPKDSLYTIIYKDTTPSNLLYNYSYNIDTGIQIREVGHLNNKGTDQEALKVRGSYNYTDNEGNIFRVSYIADKNGFHPEGVHLPTIPPLIQKALQYIAENPPKNAGYKNDGSAESMSKIDTT